MTAWVLRTAELHRITQQPDQWAAFDTLREMPLRYFGLLVTAEAHESMNPIGIRTSALLYRWGRELDARLAIAIAVDQGLPDTTEADEKFRLEEVQRR